MHVPLRTDLMQAPAPVMDVPVRAIVRVADAQAKVALVGIAREMVGPERAVREMAVRVGLDLISVTVPTLVIDPEMAVPEMADRVADAPVMVVLVMVVLVMVVRVMVARVPIVRASEIAPDTEDLLNDR